jgi:hypothetical protein
MAAAAGCVSKLVHPSRAQGLKKDRRLIRAAWFGAALFALLSAALFAAHSSERRLMARLAERIDAGRQLTSDQRLELYVRFARRELRDPVSPGEIHPWPVRLYYVLNPLHPGPGDVVQWGSDYRGSCGSHSRVVTAMLEARGVPSRLRLLLDDRGRSLHTVVEARAGGRWVVGDAAFGVAFFRRDGVPATAADLAADTAFFRAQVDTIAGYQRSFDYNSTTLLNWQKVPVVLPALRAGLERVLGPERVAELVRPRIWMWPRLFYSLVCLVLSVTCALWGWRLSAAAREADR